MVESQPSKLLVAGSIPVSRSRGGGGGGGRGERWSLRPTATVGRVRAGRERRKADVAQLAERVLGKDEVTSSILVIGSSYRNG